MMQIQAEKKNKKGKFYFDFLKCYNRFKRNKQREYYEQ